MKYAKIYRAKSNSVSETVLNNITDWNFDTDTLTVDGVPFEKAVFQIKIWDDLGGVGNALVDDSGASYSGPLATSALETKELVVLMCVQYGEDLNPSEAQRSATNGSAWYVAMLAENNPKAIKYCAEQIPTTGGWFDVIIKDRIIHVCDVWISEQNFKGLEDYDSWPYVETIAKGTEDYDSWPFVDVTAKGTEDYDSWPYVATVFEGSEDYDSWPHVMTTPYGVEYYTDFPV